MTLKYFFIISLVFIQFYNTGNILASYFSYILVLVLLVFNILNLKKYKKKEIKFSFTRSDALVLLFLVSLVRSFFQEAITISTFAYTTGILIMFSTLIKADVQKVGFWNAFLKAISIVVIVNLSLYFFGLTSDIFRPIRKVNIRVLEYIGFAVKRVNFLIFANFAYYSMLVSLLVLGSFTLVNWSKKGKLIVYSTGLLTLFLLDARGPMLFLILILIFQKILLKINSKNLVIFFIGVIVVPFIFSIISSYFGLGEEGTQELASSRDIIWSFFLTNYDPNILELIFGYGYLGHYISGISEQYEFLFGEWGNSSQISLHNSYLQYLTDLGLLGITILFYISKSTLKRIDFLGNKKAKLILLYFLIVGVSEMSIQINNFVNFYLFLAFTNYFEYRYEQYVWDKNIVAI